MKYTILVLLVFTNCLAWGFIPASTVSWKDRLKRQLLDSALDLHPNSDLFPSSISFANADLESYTSGGIPIWVPALCVSLVGVTVITPLVMRKLQLQRNTINKKPENSNVLLGEKEEDAYARYYKNETPTDKL